MGSILPVADTVTVMPPFLDEPTTPVPPNAVISPLTVTVFRPVPEPELSSETPSAEAVMVLPAAVVISIAPVPVACTTPRMPKPVGPALASTLPFALMVILPVPELSAKMPLFTPAFPALILPDTSTSTTPALAALKLRATTAEPVAALMSPEALMVTSPVAMLLTSTRPLPVPRFLTVPAPV